MNVDRITRNWFNTSVSIFDKEDKEYCKPCSSEFDQNIFSWQRFSCEFCPLIDNWMIATGKELPDICIRLNQILTN